MLWTCVAKLDGVGESMQKRRCRLGEWLALEGIPAGSFQVLGYKSPDLSVLWVVFNVLSPLSFHIYI